MHCLVHSSASMSWSVITASFYQTMIRSLRWRDETAKRGALPVEHPSALAMRVLVDIQSTSRETSQHVDPGHVALQAAPHLCDGCSRLSAG